MSIEEIQAGLKKLERLADLAFGVASASDVNLVRQSIMMSAQSDITELEKAIACIALYWYNQNVVEAMVGKAKQTGGGGSTEITIGISYRPLGIEEERVVHSLNFPNEEGKSVFGGAVGMLLLDDKLKIILNEKEVTDLFKIPKEKSIFCDFK